MTLIQYQTHSFQNSAWLLETHCAAPVPQFASKSTAPASVEKIQKAGREHAKSIVDSLNSQPNSQPIFGLMTTPNPSSKSSSSPERPNVSIQHLPPELYGAIFQLYVESFNLCEPENLLLVCRSWYDLAIGQATLWRFIILDPAVLQRTPYQSLHAYVHNRLVRSRSCPLAISLTGYMDDPDDYEAAFHLLLATTSRWKELWLTYKTTTRPKPINLLRSLTSPTPVLRTIRWRSSYVASEDYSIILPYTPSLSRVDIEVSGGMRLPQSICKSATTASVISQHLGVFQEILSQFQNIRHLILPPLDHLPALTPPTPITLPSLQKLTIKVLRSTSPRIMVLNLPSLGTLEVDINPGAPWPVQRSVFIRNLRGLLSSVHTIILRNMNFESRNELRALLEGGLQVKQLVCSGVGRWDWVKANNTKLGWVFAFQEDFYSVLEDRNLCPLLEQCVLEGQVQEFLLLRRNACTSNI